MEHRKNEIVLLFVLLGIICCVQGATWCGCNTCPCETTCGCKPCPCVKAELVDKLPRKTECGCPPPPPCSDLSDCPPPPRCDCPEKVNKVEPEFLSHVENCADKKDCTPRRNPYVNPEYTNIIRQPLQGGEKAVESSEESSNSISASDEEVDLPSGVDDLASISMGISPDSEKVRLSRYLENNEDELQVLEDKEVKLAKKLDEIEKVDDQNAKNEKEILRSSLSKKGFPQAEEKEKQEASIKASHREIFRQERDYKRKELKLRQIVRKNRDLLKKKKIVDKLVNEKTETRNKNLIKTDEEFNKDLAWEKEQFEAEQKKQMSLWKKAKRDEIMEEKNKKPQFPIPITSAFADFKRGYATPAADLTAGVCILSGVVGGADLATHIGTVPPMCKPRGRHVFDTHVRNLDTGRVDLLRNGAVVFVNGSSNGGWFSFDGIIYPVAGRGVPIQLGDGWMNYGNSYSQAVYYLNKGLCSITGLVKLKDTSAQTWNDNIGRINPRCRPEGRLVFHVNSHENTHRVDIFPNGKITWMGGVKRRSWLSLDGISFAKAQNGLSLKNNWLEFGNGYRSPGYSKIQKLCILSGIVVSPAGINQKDMIAKLPKSCRPRSRIVFSTVMFSESAKLGMARIDVFPDGRVRWVDDEDYHTNRSSVIAQTQRVSFLEELAALSVKDSDEEAAKREANEWKGKVQELEEKITNENTKHNKDIEDLKLQNTFDQAKINKTWEDKIVDIKANESKKLRKETIKSQTLETQLDHQKKFSENKLENVKAIYETRMKDVMKKATEDLTEARQEVNKAKALHFSTLQAHKLTKGKLLRVEAQYQLKLNTLETENKKEVERLTNSIKTSEEEHSAARLEFEKSKAVLEQTKQKLEIAEQKLEIAIRQIKFFKMKLSSRNAREPIVTYNQAIETSEDLATGGGDLPTIWTNWWLSLDGIAFYVPS